MAKDLNAKSTIISLMDYGIKMVETVVGSVVPEGDESWNDIPKIMDHTGACLLGDGSPSHAITPILRQQAEKYKDKVKG